MTKLKNNAAVNVDPWATKSESTLKERLLEQAKPLSTKQALEMMHGWNKDWDVLDRVLKLRFAQKNNKNKGELSERMSRQLDAVRYNLGRAYTGWAEQKDKVFEWIADKDNKEQKLVAPKPVFKLLEKSGQSLDDLSIWQNPDLKVLLCKSEEDGYGYDTCLEDKQKLDNELNALAALIARFESAKNKYKLNEDDGQPAYEVDDQIAYKIWEICNRAEIRSKSFAEKVLSSFKITYDFRKKVKASPQMSQDEQDALLSREAKYPTNSRKSLNRGINRKTGHLKKVGTLFAFPAE